MTSPADRGGGEAEILPVLTSRTETRAFYNRISRVYDLMAERSEQPPRQAGLEMMAPQSGERILEVGCGTGHSLLALGQAVGSAGRVIGLDLAEAMTARALRLVTTAGQRDRVRLQCGDAAALPYRDGTFDGAFLSFTLELFDTPEIPTVLAECRRVLRPGGRIVVIAMSRQERGSLATQIFEWSHRHFPNFVDCRPIYVRSSLERAGFVITADRTERMWIRVEIVAGVRPT